MSKTAHVQQALEVLGSIPPGKSLPVIKGRKIKSTTRYIAGLANTNLENGEMLLPSTVPAFGITNFPKGNQIDNYMLVTGVRMLFDTTVGVAVKTAAFESKAPANFYNGELQISQSGEGILFESSVSDVTNKKASTGNDTDFREVTPFLIRPNTAFSLKVNLAGAAAADQAYKLELRCEEFTDLNK